MIFYGSSGYDVGIEPSEKRKEFNVQCTGLFGFREAGSHSCHVTANQWKFLTFQLPSGVRGRDQRLHFGRIKVVIC